MEPIKKIITILVIYGFLLIFLVLFLNNILSFDEYLFFLLRSMDSNILLFFNLITYFGSSIFWVFLIAIFWLKNKRKISLQLLFVFILDTISLLILKNVFLRIRPFEKFQLGIDFDIGPSFPSGHSQRAFSGAVVLSNHYKKYKSLFYVLAALTAFSRIFLGLHYPLDVITGSINGIIFGITVLAIPIKKKFFKKFL